MTHPVPLALYVGPGHVLTAVNETWAVLYPREPPIGLPAREAFTDEWGKCLDAMDRAWETGEMQTTPCAHGESGLVIVPLMESGQIVALVTGCALEKIAPIPASPRSLLDSLLSAAAPAGQSEPREPRSAAPSA